jgi:hypothetical protein
MNFNYMKYYELPHTFDNSLWSICPYTGSLIKEYNGKYRKNKNIPQKVSEALEYCNNPYLLGPNIDYRISSKNKILLEKLKLMHDRLLKINNNRFFITRLYSSLKQIMFDNTSEAILNINSLSIQIDLKHQLCLQRAFLAAKISESFQEKGVLFIGAFLPTGDMHAWIIENGVQPDYEDNGWINYRPLIAFYH